jgi:hypothetical protein
MVSMNCRRARNLLFDFFDGLSNETLRAEVERHLGECAGCEQFAAEMSRSLALLRHAPVEPVDENFNWKVRLAIHRERNTALSRARSAGAWVKMWNYRYAVSSALAFSAVLVAGTIVVRNGSLPGPARTTDSAMQITQGTPATKADGATVERTTAPRTTTNLITPVTNDNVSQVSMGPHLITRSTSPASGPIDMTEAEAKLDSVLNADVMRLSAHQREQYLQRRMQRIQRILEHIQSQQPAPAQPQR